MKILIISNFYPPHYIGGYELRCALVAEGLQRAGNDVKVLTSRHGLERSEPIESEVKGVHIHRALGQYHHGAQAPVRRPYFLGMVEPQLRDAYYFSRAFDEFKPDVVNWWGISGLTKAILSIPGQRSIPDVFCIEDDWIVEERARGEVGERPLWAPLWRGENKPWYWHPLLVWLMKTWKAKLLKAGIETAAVPFCPTHVCFVSEFLRDDYRAAGFEFPSTEVIWGGVPVEKFLFYRHTPMASGQPLRLLYVGQITRDRGLHTVLEALSFFSAEIHSAVTLTVVGDWLDRNYQHEVREQVQVLGLSERVIFEGKKRHDDMPWIYRCHDMLISPSLRKEGLPLTMMEAMLSGCAVATTGSGGASEIARMAGLPLFPKSDARALSLILQGVLSDRRNLHLIADRGQRVALKQFSSERMVQRFQKTFEKLHKARKDHKPTEQRIHNQGHMSNFPACGPL